MAQKGETAVKKWFLGAKKWVIGREKLWVGNQTRKAKWCKMQVLFFKIDKLEDVKGYKKCPFTYFLT